jgi:ribonucleoside-diphosphate reductase 2, operon protein nrdI
MKIIFHSMTGNVKRFLSKTQFPCHALNEMEKVGEPFVIVTNTVGFGEPPQRVLHFLEQNKNNLCGVAASGNRNWGANFAHAADVIHQQYAVPILLKFELSGTDKDVFKFRKEMEEIDATYSCRI